MFQAAVPLLKKAVLRVAFWRAFSISITEVPQTFEFRRLTPFPQIFALAFFRHPLDVC
jgi:hypothetical protein